VPQHRRAVRPGTPRRLAAFVAVRDRGRKP
jgi:hypothetical protein